MRRFLAVAVLLSFLPGCILATCAAPSRSSSKKEKVASKDDDDEDDDRAERKRKKKTSATARTADPTPPVKTSTAAKPPAIPPPIIPTVPPTAPTQATIPTTPTATTPTTPSQPEEDRATARRWAHQVALGTEFAGTGKSREGIVARWNKPIRLSVMRGDAAVRADLLSVIPTLNEALSPAGAPIRVVEDGDAGAEMKVWFAPSSAFDGIAKTNGFNYIEGNDGYFFTFWNDRFEMTRAYIFLATDLLHGTRLRHVSLEELTQSLGLSNDSTLVRESIFYENAADPTAERVFQTELTSRDRKLLSFFYTHVSPGDDTATMGRAFDLHWR